MPRRGPVLLAAVLALGSLSLSGPAGAATSFGNACTNVGSGGASTVVALSGASAAPQDGVVTRVRVVAPPYQPVWSIVLKTVRPVVGLANGFTTVTSTALSTVSGAQEHAVRVPVVAGDRLALSGPSAFICSTGSTADRVGTTPGDVAAGSTAVYTESGAGQAVPVVATVEPDADKDGFGDETQDLCPQSATAQAACPVVKVDATAKASTRRITVTVTADQPTTVTVGGTARKRPRTFPLSGGPSAVAPGTLGKVVVALPTKLRAALAELPRTKKVRVVLVLSATNPAGAPTTARVELRLRGTAR